MFDRQANLQLNQLRNVVAYNYALADAVGSFTWAMHPSSYTTMANFAEFPVLKFIKWGDETFATNEFTDEAVLVNQLDHFDPKGKISLLKVDV